MARSKARSRWQRGQSVLAAFAAIAVGLPCFVPPGTSRRLLLGAWAVLAPGLPPAAAELKPPPKEGSCVGCLGVVDDLLARCTGDLKGCVSSQDDRPEVFEPPWQLPEPKPGAKDPTPKLAAELRDEVQRAGGRILSFSDDKRYLRAEFLVDVPVLGKDADDVEWYFTPDDLILQFRAERRSGSPDFGENRRRLEAIRLALGWDIVPVLRNRQRAFFFGESPLDQFGPALYDALSTGKDPTPYKEQVLEEQAEKLKGSGLPLPSLLNLRRDDLGAENADGILDKATRDYLRSKCDARTQTCE